MISCDTNILVYAYDVSAEQHPAAHQFLTANLESREFGISELVLFEFYLVLRNPTIFQKPLAAESAVGLIQELRSNPYWTVLKDTIDVSDQIWELAAGTDFPRRAIFDARIAFSLAAEGVTQFATNNVKDFERFGVFEVFNPIAT